MEWLTLFLVAIVSILIISYLAKRPAVPFGLKTLPGPTGLPIVGYLPFLGRFPFLKLTVLGQKYGSLYQLSLGRKKLVVLNSREVIQEAFIKDWKFNGRPNTPLLQTFLDATSGGFSIMTGDQKWKFFRKNSIKALSMFATSKSSRLEALVGGAVESMNEKFAAAQGHPADPQQTVSDCISTIIGSINFGSQFDSTNPALKRLIHLGQEFADAGGTGNFVDYLPMGSLLLAHQAKRFAKVAKEMCDLVTCQLERHSSNTEEVRDVADALEKVAREVSDEELQEIGIRRSEIQWVAQDLFGAGFGTTLETFVWCLNILAAEQKVQAKLHEELERVLQKRKPTLNDRGLLPYTEALLLEVFRFSSLTPLLLPHEAMEDTELCGYHIPKGSTVVANVWGVHHDESVFKNPLKFEPERFLTSDGRNVDSMLAQLMLPFGSGKRRCVGENLARQELFLLIASVFQRFQVEPAPGERIDLNASKTGFTRAPIEYELVFKELSKSDALCK